MRFFKKPLSPLASVAWFTYVQASYLNSDLSFGHQDRISPSLRAIPNWNLEGSPNPPEILSNKIVLTPPAPGNARGAAWGEKVLENSEWTADIAFRATGPERGGGNLQIWYTNTGRDVGTSSIYTVGRFDGLVLIVDQYVGSGGYIRGFLSDGSIDYKSHHSVDSLAFGHCEYSYRNLGRPSRLSIRQTKDSFRVDIDGKQCFESSKIKLPLGYNFGITAASAEIPDSFEVFSFVVATESHTPDAQQQNQQNQQAFGSTPQDQNLVQNQNQNQQTGDIPSFSDPPEVPASEIRNSDAQFADLHNRLQAMTKHINSINREIASWQQRSNARSDKFENLLNGVSSSLNSLSKLNALENMERKMDTISNDMRQMKSDLHQALDRHVAGIKGEVRATHSTLMGSVADNAVGLGKYVLVVLGSQGLLILAYLGYKRRKAMNPKKYL
ncbi:hypothetical protein B7494_g8257 [Chlorociboria aeruginascens]|nr:hypothetical protein B7494_g8257 [Chlorociboria aeruginascens]